MLHLKLFANSFESPFAIHFHTKAIPLFPLGVACINPPVPPAWTNLYANYTNGSTVTFGDTVAYKCNSGYYFDQNYYQNNFTLQCYSNGSWQNPGNWSQFCVDPASKLKNHSFTCTVHIYWPDENLLLR
jgi:hypothetical protein